MVKAAHINEWQPGIEVIQGMPPGFEEAPISWFSGLGWFFFLLVMVPFYYLHKLRLFLFSGFWRCWIFGHDKHKHINFQKNGYTLVCKRCKKYFGGGKL